MAAQAFAGSIPAPRAPEQTDKGVSLFSCGLRQVEAPAARTVTQFDRSALCFWADMDMQEGGPSHRERRSTTLGAGTFSSPFP